MTGTAKKPQIASFPSCSTRIWYHHRTVPRSNVRTFLSTDSALNLDGQGNRERSVQRRRGTWMRRGRTRNERQIGKSKRVVIAVDSVHVDRSARCRVGIVVGSAIDAVVEDHGRSSTRGNRKRRSCAERSKHCEIHLLQVRTWRGELNRSLPSPTGNALSIGD